MVFSVSWPLLKEETLITLLPSFSLKKFTSSMKPSLVFITNNPPNREGVSRYSVKFQRKIGRDTKTRQTNEFRGNLPPRAANNTRAVKP